MLCGAGSSGGVGRVCCGRVGPGSGVGTRRDGVGPGSGVGMCRDRVGPGSGRGGSALWRGLERGAERVSAGATGCNSG
jgi:hypothetical protein